MPIDDVDYLYENSVKDSFMLFIDSGARDRNFFPDPDEYVIHFEEPLKFVYGLDILDATIPNTMHNIDHHNNTISFAVLRSSDSSADNMPQRNDFLNSTITELQENETFRKLFLSDVTFDACILDRDDWMAHPELAEYLASPIPVGEEPAEPPHDSFIILRSQFKDVPLLKLSTVPEGGRMAYIRDSSYVSLVAQGEVYLVRSTHALNALLDDGVEKDSIYVRQSSSNAWEVTVTSNVLVPKTHGTYGDVISRVEGGMAHHVLQKVTADIETGQYDVNSLQAELQELFIQHDIFVLGTDRSESSDLTKQGRILFVNNEAPFVMIMDTSSIHENIGFDRFVVDGKPNDYARVIFNDTKRMYGSVYDAKRERFILRAPGNINLLGTRYVTLRCKEIEDHLSSSVTYNTFSTGIGVFKLQDLRDVTNLRFDFSTFLQKPFHPIGKLSRLTLRFETPHGKPYDFKGFNHNIMISIKYFSPNKRQPFKRSALNPNYDPDYIRYITNIAYFTQVDDEADDGSGESGGGTTDDDSDSE